MIKRLCKSIAVVLLLSAPQVFAETFIISDIRVEGLQRISAGSVFAALPVGVGDTIDPRAIRASARSLFATGNFDDIRIGRDGNVLVVVVAERPSISEINIEGNKAIETEALLDGLKGAGLAVGQVFQRSTLEGMQMELQRIWLQDQTTSVYVTHMISEAIFLADRVIVMTPSPGTIKSVVPVDLPRPRPLHVQRTVPFIRLEAQIWDLLEPAGGLSEPPTLRG